MLLTIITFLVVTGLVGYISWLKTRNDDLSTSKGYFLAGRGLSATVYRLFDGLNLPFYRATYRRECQLLCR
ncbi:putative transporter [Mannheimia haemolytica]|uniref:Putative transporter n=1 Tax=Mannheimia haemolytica TaxID=75985 RepID=A0A378N606_MANHA|nr:putative transporter [Mannheimia haemolytica]